MKISKVLILSSLVATGTMAISCSEKKSFQGAANTTTAPQAAEQAPEEPKDEPIEKDPVVPEEPETDNVFKDCISSKSTAFVADLYRLEKGNENLKPLDVLSPVKQICIKQLDIADREFTEGFPGVDGLYEWFGLKIRTKVKITKAGSYKFRVSSDDGSRVSINGKEIIDNDGQHSVRSRDSSIELAEGSHEIEVKYFQGPANRIALELFWTPPGESESHIPLDQLSRP